MSVIAANVEACDGYGNCVFAAPEYFDIDGNGVVKLLREEIADGDRRIVEHAVAECPAAALRIADAADTEESS